MPRSSPSLADIARHAGVAISTVSRVLRGKGTVSPATARRITASAKRLRYRPNLLVQGMQTGRSRTIGVMVPVDDPFHAELVCGIHDTLVAADYAPLVLWSGSSRPLSRTVTELEQLHRLIDRRVDGIILRPVTDDADDVYFREAVSRDLPVIAVDRVLAKVQVDFVGCADADGARLVAEHLLALGHRHLGHVAGALFTSTGRQRHDAFLATAAAAGATCLVVEDPTFSDGEMQARQLLAASPRITAVFCANDLLAAGAYRAAARLGRRIPADLSIIGFGDLPIAALMAPPLTTVHQPAYQIGSEAAARMLVRCAGERSAPRRRLVPVTFTPRASTARVP
jgi:DNA-binding LacI/PurR family transcriptional regulator